MLMASSVSHGQSDVCDSGLEGWTNKKLMCAGCNKQRWMHVMFVYHLQRQQDSQQTSPQRTRSTLSLDETASQWHQPERGNMEGEKG